MESSEQQLIFQAFARSFAKSGPKGIVLVARSAEGLEAAAKDIKDIDKGIKVLVVPTDLSDTEAITALWEKVEQTFGYADVLVNNAAVGCAKKIGDAPAEKWWSDFVSHLNLC